MAYVYPMLEIVMDLVCGFKEMSIVLCYPLILKKLVVVWGFQLVFFQHKEFVVLSSTHSYSYYRQMEFYHPYKRPFKITGFHYWFFISFLFQWSHS